MTLLAEVIRCAEDAGSLIQRVAERARGAVDLKSGGDPVTEADRGADELLRKRLQQLGEAAAWLSEETADDLTRLDHDRVWIVDPLDGTKEFIEGVPQYAVSVALVEKGRPVLGVIHNPATGETFHAERGSGTFRNGERVRLNANDQPPFRLLASRTEMRAGEFQQFDNATWQLDPIGSIAYKLALVASGAAALTLSRGPKWEWDVCAGALLVSEAGGAASDVQGVEFRFNQRFPKVPGILAGSTAAVARASDAISRIGVSARMNELSGRER